MRIKTGLIGLSLIVGLTGCGSKDSIEVVDTGEVVIDDSVDTENKSYGKKVDTTIIDKYLYNKSHKDLVVDKEPTVGIFGKLKLKEPLEVQGSIIPITQSDSDVIEVEGEERVDFNNELEVELPEPKLFLYNLKEYIGNRLLDSGYLIIYSMTEEDIAEEEDLFGAEYRFRNLKIGMEAIESTNTTIRELFKDDEELISYWDSCYEQLIKGNEILNKIESYEHIVEYNKDIDITAMYTSYDSLKGKIDTYIVGFNPYNIDNN